MFSVAGNGALINVANVGDGGPLELDGANAVALVAVGTTDKLFVAGADDHGVSAFSLTTSALQTQVGTDFRANSTTTGDQVGATVTALPDGRFVVTWQSSDSGDGAAGCVRARIFNADGNAAGADFILNSTTTGDQLSPAMTALPDGHFVVTWQSNDGGDGSSGCIRARLFSADGSAVGTDFIVNSTGTSTQANPTATALPDGHFLVAWESSDNGDGSNTCIRARLFDANGSAVGVDFIVNSTTANQQLSPAVTALPDGHFVIAWHSLDGGDGSGYGIRARLFNADGSPVSNDFIVNSTTFADQFAPSVTGLPDGHFVVAWQSNNDSGDGSGTGIRARMFNADGSAVGTDFIVNSTTTNNQVNPIVTALPDGHFVVTWHSGDGGDGSGNSIRGRLFSADGTAAGNDFIVNSTGTGSQTNPAIAVLPDGRVVGAWQSLDSGVNSDIRTAILSFNQANDAPITDLNGAGAGNNSTASFTGQPLLIAPAANVTDTVLRQPDITDGNPDGPTRRRRRGIAIAQQRGGGVGGDRWAHSELHSRNRRAVDYGLGECCRLSVDPARDCLHQHRRHPDDKCPYHRRRRQ